MSDGRTIWRAKDCLWHEREWIVILVEEFGPAGYAVIDYLEAQAKLQNDGGMVKSGPRSASRATGAEAATVAQVLARAVVLGLLGEYRESNGRFVCRIAWFAADQQKGLAANRQARQRNGATVEPDDPPPLSRSVTHRHGESRGVTNTVQNSTTTATQSKDNAELRSAVIECFAYWQERCNHGQAQLTADRRAKIERCLRERSRLVGGMRQAVTDVRQAIDGAALAPFIDTRGKRHDEIELICRTGSKLEDFMGRATLPGATVHTLPTERDERRERRARRAAALDHLTGQEATA